MGESISHSAVESYTLCRRKFYYGYTLDLQRETESVSLTEGSLGHEVLGTFYKSILKAGDTVKEQQDHFWYALEDAREFFKAQDYSPNPKRRDLEDTLFEEYFSQEPFVRKGWRILAVEKKFKLYYNEDRDSLPFVIDLIALDPKGKTVIIDHKFMYNFISYQEADLMPQIPKYMAGVRALGFAVDYGVYNMLRTRKDAREVCDTMKLKPNDTRVQRTFMEQIGVADEIAQRKKLPVDVQEATSYRTANKMVCQMCSFRDLCSEELAGGNVELSLKYEYKKREHGSGKFDGPNVIHN